MGQGLHSATPSPSIEVSGSKPIHRAIKNAVQWGQTTSYHITAEPGSGCVYLCICVSVVPGLFLNLFVCWFGPNNQANCGYVDRVKKGSLSQPKLKRKTTAVGNVMSMTVH